MWVEVLNGCSDIVDEGPPCRSPFLRLHQGSLALLHKGPLFVDDFVGVGTGEFLDVGAFWLREPIAQPEDLSHGVCLLLYRVIGRLEALPNSDNHQRNQNGVDHTQRRVDEACHVVVLLARLSWHEALHQEEPAKGEEAYPADHEHAIYCGEYQRGSPLVSLTSRYFSCYYGCATNFLELRQCKVPRIPLPRTQVNHHKPQHSPAHHAPLFAVAGGEQARPPSAP